MPHSRRASDGVDRQYSSGFQATRHKFIHLYEGQIHCLPTRQHSLIAFRTSALRGAPGDCMTHRRLVPVLQAVPCTQETPWKTFPTFVLPVHKHLSHIRCPFASSTRTPGRQGMQGEPRRALRPLLRRQLPFCSLSKSNYYPDHPSLTSRCRSRTSQ